MINSFTKTTNNYCRFCSRILSCLCSETARSFNSLEFSISPKLSGISNLRQEGLHMKTIKRSDLNFRLEAVNSAQKIGVAKTAELFNLTRDTVYRWLNGYRSSGLQGLANKSRLEQHHPRKLSAAVRVEIVQLQILEPQLTLQNIIDRLKLNCSVSTVCKFLSRQQTPAISFSFLKKQIPPFSYFYYNVEKIAGSDSTLPVYLLQLKEVTTGMTFFAFSAENSPNSTGVFADWFLTHLRQLSGLNNPTVFICKGRFTHSRGVKEGFFEIVSKQKFAARITVSGEKIKLDNGLFNLILNHQNSETTQFRSLFYNCAVQSNLAKSAQISDWQQHEEMVSSMELLPALFDYLFSQLAEQSQSAGDLATLTAYSELFALLELSGYQDQSKQTGFLLSFSEALDRCGEWKKAEQTILKVLESVKFNSSPTVDEELKALEFIAGINEKNGRYLKAAQYYKKAIIRLSAAQADRQIDLLVKTGFCYQACGEFKLAVDCYRRIASLPGTENQYISAKGIAGVYYAKGNYQHANKLLRKLLPLTQNMAESTQKAAEICGELGCTYLYLRDYATAEFYISRQLEHLKTLQQEEKYYHTQGVLGITRYYLQKKAEGDICFAEYTGYLIKIADQTTDSLVKINNWSEIAGVKKVAEDYEGAILYIKKANLLAEQLDNLNKLSFGYLMLGCIYQELAKYHKALKYFRRVLEISEQQKEFRIDFFAIYNIATTYYQLQDKANAQIWYEKVLEIAEDSNNQQARLDCVKQLALLAYEQQNYTQSIAYCRNYLALSASNSSTDQGAVYHCLARSLLQMSEEFNVTEI